MSSSRVKRKLKGYRRPKVNYREARERVYAERRAEFDTRMKVFTASSAALLAAASQEKGE